LTSARVIPAERGAVVVEVVVFAPAHTPTQPPVFGNDAPGYGESASYLAVEPNVGDAARAFPDLPGAWRVGVAAEGAVPGSRPASPTWPWRASLAAPELATTWNRANVVLPAKAGEVHVRVRVAPPAGAHALTIALVRDGVASETRTEPLP
jgi:hypothetical protein